MKNINEDCDNHDKVIDETTKISPAYGGLIGGISGLPVSYAGIYFSGKVLGVSAAGLTSGLASIGSLVGGGMLVGIPVVMLPCVAFGIIGYKIVEKKSK